MNIIKSTDLKNIVISTVIGLILLILGYLVIPSNKIVFILLLLLVILLAWQLYVTKKKLKDAEDPRKLGIIKIEHALQGSPLAPRACMQATNQYLDFSGILGTKWVEDTESIEEFRKLLRRVTTNNGKVRFTLINPSGEAIKELAKTRGLPIDTYLYAESIKKYKELVDEFSCMEVRLINQLPSFRLILKERKTLAVARYRFEANRTAGWVAPHMIIVTEIDDKEVEWSLYYSFHRYYEEVWKKSIDIKEIFKNEGGNKND